MTSHSWQEPEGGYVRREGKNGIPKVSAKAAHENDSPHASSYAPNNSYGRPGVIFCTFWANLNAPG